MVLYKQESELANGDEKMTTIQKLQNEKCFNTNGKLLKWPEWLTWEEVQSLVKQGLLVKKFYRNCFNHTDYILKNA